MAYDPTVFNVDPYYDDYNDDKKFLRVLYKPGYAVQARELTQAQTIAQKQIQRFGDHMFKDGSIVSESQVTSVKGRYVRVGGLTGYAGVSVGNFDGLTATVSGKNTIKITAVASPLTGSNKDTTSIFFFGEYLGGATGFTYGDVISSKYNGVTISATVTGGTAPYGVYTNAPNSLPYSGDAFLIGVDSGVRFIKGYFVNHDAQKTILYTLTGTSPSTYRHFGYLNTSAYFDVANTIVTATDDTSLNDPAFGSYNYAAPGADRYRLDLTLTHDAGTGTTSQYVIAKYEDNLLSYISNRPKYNIIADELARRTYDESGNYTVDDFQIFAEDLTGNEQGIQINIGPGKAYVFGYEYVNPYKKSLTADKAREYRTLVDPIPVPFIIGNTVDVTRNPTLTSDVYRNIAFNDSPLFFLSSATGGTFSKVGSCRLGKFDAVENTNTVHLYDVRIDSGFDPASAARLFYPGYTANNQHVFSFTDGYLNVYNPSYNNLIFPFSQDGSAYAVRKIDAHTYKIQRSVVINTGAGGSGTLDLSQFAAGTEFTGALNCNFSSNAEFKFFSATGGVFTPSVSLISGLQASYSSAPTGLTAVVFAAIEVNESGGDAYVRAKTATTETATVKMRDNGFEKFAYINGNVDVYQIISITGNTGGSNFSMTNYFDLDPGYRDDIYDWSKIVLKRDYYSAGVTGVSLTYKRYARAASCLPYAIRSYGDTTALGLGAGGTGTEYKNIHIHSFASQRGSRIPLSSCLDARPDRIKPTSFPSGATANPYDYGATGGCDLIGPNFNMEWSYFLPRTDKLVLTRDQQFKLLKGVADEKAEVPPDADDAMTLATFSFKPYTADYKEVQTFLSKNRRYTMRDIGVLDKKLSRVEYYTTLSLLEKDAKSLEIQDENGLNKYKNGIFTDDFTSRTNADINNQDHKAAIDPLRQEARPKFITKYADLSLTGSVPSGITFTANGMLMCNYTQDLFQQQPKAARPINVNPYSVINYLGRVTLTPQTDDWIDVETRPDLVVKIDNAQGVADNEVVDIGTVWDDWQTTWTGTPVPVAGWAGQWFATRSWMVSQTQGFTERTRQVQTDFRQVRAGTRNTLVAEETSRYLGKRVIDTSIIPYMRAVNIGFKGDGFRPNVRVYPFFDNVSIADRIAINGVTSSAPLVTDSSGRLGYSQDLVFRCPAGVFRTGDRSFRLIDDPNNNIYLSTTNGESHFGSSGLKRVEEGTTLSVRDLTLRRQSVTEEQSGTLLSNESSVISFTVRSHDPVAQTFFVDPVMYPSGMFLKKIDLYFKTKSDTIPVRVELRPTLNGYPKSNQILGFGVVSLLPSQVNISSDATVPTSFVFENPVYIQPGECSMCVLSNSNDYEVWVSEMGLNDITTGERITVQPSMGSFFKSQNASTWTAEQMMDLKFTIYKCLFDTTGGTLTFKYDETDFSVQGAGINNGVNLWHFNNTTITPARTAITYTTEFESEPGTQFPTQVRTNLQFPVKKSVANASQNTITVRPTLITENENVSPAIDLERFSGLYVQNLVNSFAGSEATQETYEKLPSVGGITADSCAAFRYITRKVNLQDGFESDNVDVFLDARLPANARIKVYMRSQAPYDSSPFREIPFERLEVHPDYLNKLNANFVPQFVSNGEDDFVDLRFIRGATGTTGSMMTSGITGQTTFKNFQVKVVMYGDPDDSVVPSFKNFRVVAT